MSTRAPLVVIDDATSAGSLAAAPCAVVVGNFDGVHLGHQAVLRQVVADARRSGLASSVLTFDPHPAAVVAGGAPPVLTTLDRRAELMGEVGIDRVYVRRFDEAFAAWPPERFARELLAGALEARIVVVGENFRFGAKRAGDLALLRRLGSELGFEARAHPVATDAGGAFSSTRAREAIVAADLVGARRVLGRPHELSGKVVHGDERGRLLGFPTANLEGVAEMRPPDGVYAVQVDQVAEPFGARSLAGGVMNLGLRPTVGGGARTLETFLIDFAGDLYGATLRLRLLRRLRGEVAFASLDELRAQIARDVSESRAVLAAE